MHLYELAEEAVALHQLCEMDQGEWTTEHEALEQELTAQLAKKADAFGGYLASLDARAEAIKHEEQRLYARRAAIENHIGRLKSYAIVALETMGKEKVGGTFFTLGLQWNPPKVVVGTEPLPDEYVRIVPEERVPDRVKLLQALKAGTEVPGATLVRTRSFRVR
jgi:hypothetical protein